MIKVLIADKSPQTARYIRDLLSEDEKFSVLNIVNNSSDTIELARSLKPDLLLMDLALPHSEDGFEVIRVIMETSPLPIVIMSYKETNSQTVNTFNALQAGAVALISKPEDSDPEKRTIEESKLKETVRLMSEVKVVTRRRKKSQRDFEIESEIQPKSPLVVIGASTGGPPVLQAILSNLPANFPSAILVVQHITEGFVNGLQVWLERTTNKKVLLASHGEKIIPGRVYIAPDNCQMGVDFEERIVLRDDPPENNIRPSVSYLFRSSCRVYKSALIAVLLTGMGKDGAKEMKQIREYGGITIAQDRDSSIVYGMPGAAIEYNAVRYIFDPAQIAQKLPAFTHQILKRIEKGNKDELI
ncbi:Chemotaxis response regulator protein-glutamate methylesterase CheB [Chitinispirillum alkaliphilum]|nr:Chemotaxis response regulator protein-glutamate methylesterase CheB [Chitinispirillum alkaliphilum]